MISVRCPSCGATYRVGEKFAGKRARCKCGATIPVPSAPPPSPVLEDFGLEPVNYHAPPTPNASLMEYLFEESFSTAVQPGGLTNAPFDQAPYADRAVIEVATPENSAMPAELLRGFFQRVLLEHLQGAATLVRGPCQLQVVVISCAAKGGDADLRLLLTGRINGQPINHKTVATRATQRYHGGGILGAVISHAVISVAHSMMKSNASSPHLKHCLDEAAADLRLFLDKQLGRPKSHLAVLWTRLQWGSWLIAAISWAVIYFAAANRIPGRPVHEHLKFFCLLPAGMTYLACYGISLLVMPERFFREDPRGIKAFARTNAKNIARMRVAAVFICVLFGSIGVFMAYGAFNLRIGGR